MDVRVKLWLLHFLGLVADWVGELVGWGQRQHALGAVAAWGDMVAMVVSFHL